MPWSSLSPLELHEQPSSSPCVRPSILSVFFRTAVFSVHRQHFYQLFSKVNGETEPRTLCLSSSHLNLLLSYCSQSLLVAQLSQHFTQKKLYRSKQERCILWESEREKYLIHHYSYKFAFVRCSFLKTQILPHSNSNSITLLQPSHLAYHHFTFIQASYYIHFIHILLYDFVLHLCIIRSHTVEDEKRRYTKM